MKFALVTLAAAAAALVGAASPGVSASDRGVDASATTGRTCFRTNDMRNHTFEGDRTVYVSANREVYRIGMAGPCTAAANNNDPLLISTPGSSGIVCKPIDLNLSVNIGGALSSCIIDSIHRMTPAEVAALPPKTRP